MAGLAGLAGLAAAMVAAAMEAEEATMVAAAMAADDAAVRVAEASGVGIPTSSHAMLRLRHHRHRRTAHRTPLGTCCNSRSLL